MLCLLSKRYCFLCFKFLIIVNHLHAYMDHAAIFTKLFQASLNSEYHMAMSVIVFRIGKDDTVIQVGLHVINPDVINRDVNNHDIINHGVINHDVINHVVINHDVIIASDISSITVLDDYV